MSKNYSRPRRKSDTKNTTVRYSARYWARSEWNGYPVGVPRAKLQSLVRTRTGASVPHWKDKIKAAQDATSSLDGTWTSLSSVPGFFFTRFRYDPVNGFSQKATHEYVDEIKGFTAAYNVSVPTPDFTWTSVADGRARNKFLSEVRKEQTQMQSLVFLKELKQTWTMLHRPAEALWNLSESYYSALYQRKRRLGPKRWWTALPSMWLEYSFGWRPLMMDIDNAWDALNRLTEREYVKRVTGSGSDHSLRSQQSGDRLLDGIICPKISSIYTNRKIEQVTVRYLGGVRYRALTTFADKSAAWGFNPEEFIPSAWEILPWSFLIDYFTSIGDYLDATFAQNTNLAWALKTTRLKTVQQRIDDVDVPGSKALVGNGYVSAGGQPAVAEVKRVSVQRRAVAPGSITPALYVKWNGPSLGQWANVSALFGQACANLQPQSKRWPAFRLDRFLRS